MTLIAASIFVDDPADTGSAIDRAEQASSAGAKMIEWRIDRLADDESGRKAAVHLVSHSPAPCIVTCRHADEGGEFDGPEKERQQLIDAVLNADHPPRYIDIELAAWQHEPAWRAGFEQSIASQPEHQRTGLILSAHNFTERPTDLTRLVAAMADEPLCDVIKVAWRARSLRDNLEAFDLLRERRKPMIALCMGPFGLLSRVLAPKFGGLLTFASTTADTETAPGQPTVDDLGTLYRFDSIDSDTKVYGVIGWPVEHSLSPQIHNAGFESVGHDGVYLPLPIPEEYEHFKATVGALIDHDGLNFRGASVTIPHKEHLIRFVEERGGRIDDLAKRIGAANTLIVGTAGGLECVNTDCPAAIASLQSGDATLRGKSVALLGAGGAARAIAVGLLDAGATTNVFNRTEQRAAELIQSIQQSVTVGAGPDAVPGTITVGDLADLSRTRFDIYINCTPTGMAHGPAPDDSPLPPDAPLDEKSIVFDTVYAPRETPLIKQAEARRAKVIRGEEMFSRQAAMQFERWTGKRIPGQTDGVVN